MKNLIVFAIATNCLFAFYGCTDDFITPVEYEKILSALEKGGEPSSLLLWKKGIQEMYALKLSCK